MGILAIMGCAPAWLQDVVKNIISNIIYNCLKRLG